MIRFLTWMSRQPTTSERASDTVSVLEKVGTLSTLTSNIVKKIRVIDSHTGGEPTRVVIEGGPDLGQGPLTERLNRFRVGNDWFRSAVVNEPRGSDVIVG